MTDRNETLNRLIEAARCLGATQARQIYGQYTIADGQVEVGLHKKIDQYRAALAQPEQAAVPFPSFMRKRIEEAMDLAIKPKGMSVHDGKAKVLVSDLHRMLLVIDSVLAQPEPFSLVCPTCNADRTKEACKGDLSNCWLKGQAHSAQPEQVTDYGEGFEEGYKAALAQAGVTMADAVAAGDAVLLNEQAALLCDCRAALDSLIKQKPTLAGLLCGSNTLGNLKAELHALRPQAIFGEQA